jgi:hypothetical protein
MAHIVGVSKATYVLATPRWLATRMATALPPPQQQRLDPLP